MFRLFAVFFGATTPGDRQIDVRRRPTNHQHPATVTRHRMSDPIDPLDDPQGDHGQQCK